MTPKLPLAIVAAAAVLFHAPASAGWRGAQWGMGLEDVDAASTLPVRTVRKTLPLKTHEIPPIGGKAKWAAPFGKTEVRYRYQPDGRARIDLEIPPANCEAALEWAVTQWGQPAKVQDQVILTTVSWDDPEQENSMFALVSAPVCTLTFRPHASS